MNGPYRTRVIEVPPHLIGGPFAVQTTNTQTHKVIASISGVRSFDAAVAYAYEHRQWFGSIIVYDHEAIPRPRMAGAK